ncbi:MAG: hypothetical protein ABFS39_14245 [Pseudomonadota bacterium]
MSEKHKKSRLPRYQGQEWLDMELPVKEQPWLLGKQRSVSKDRGHRASSSETLQGLLDDNPWRWPKRPLHRLIDEGARVRILAGNHDIRIKLGIRSVGMERDPLHDHFFIRTKYREVDMPLTHKGVRLIHEAGIHAIVHGHDNRRHGQRIMVCKGMVNFECDATIDRNTRKKEGLTGCGAAVTIFHPDKLVMGVSTDYPFIKVFDPASLS